MLDNAKVVSYNKNKEQNNSIRKGEEMIVVLLVSIFTALVASATVSDYVVQGCDHRMMSQFCSIECKR